MGLSGNGSTGRLNERLAAGGFRFTPQREHVYAVLLRKRDHPTAEEVFIRAKREIPDISMATVYNCLDALVRMRPGPPGDAGARARRASARTCGSIVIFIATSARMSLTLSSPAETGDSAAAKATGPQR